MVEQLGQVVAELGVGRQDPDVFVRRGRLRVVVAGADVAVTADAVRLLAHDQQDLGVGLEADEAVHHVRARLFQHSGSLDVGLLVEARLELYERDDLLAGLRRLGERRDDARLVAAGAVQRLLDREDVRITGRLVDERLDRVGKRVVRVVDEHVLVAHGPEHVDVVDTCE